MEKLWRGLAESKSAFLDEADGDLDGIVRGFS